MINAEGKITHVQVISRNRFKYEGASSFNWRVMTATSSCASRMRLILFLPPSVRDNNGIPCNGPRPLRLPVHRRGLQLVTRLLD